MGTIKLHECPHGPSNEDKCPLCEEQKGSILGLFVVVAIVVGSIYLFLLCFGP